MRRWPFVLGAGLALGATAVVITLAVRRQQATGSLDDISDLITDCHSRLDRIETELHQLKPVN